MKPRFITDEKGNKKEVVLPMGAWDKLIDKLEDLEDDIVGLKYRAEKNPKYYSSKQVERELKAVWSR